MTRRIWLCIPPKSIHQHLTRDFLVVVYDQEFEHRQATPAWGFLKFEVINGEVKIAHCVGAQAQVSLCFPAKMYGR